MSVQKTESIRLEWARDATKYLSVKNELKKYEKHCMQW